MNIITFLIMSGCLIHVNCISKDSCDTKCGLIYRNSTNKIIYGNIIDNKCNCSIRIGYGFIRDINDNYCERNYQGTFMYYDSTSRNIDSNFNIKCLKPLKCDKSLCDDYCNYEYPNQERISYCHEEEQCICEKKSKNNNCIISTNEDYSSITYYNRQNESSINDILFRLKELNSQLCPLVPVYENHQLDIENGTIIDLSSKLHRYENHNCEISCEHNGKCDRCFSCLAKYSR